MLLPKSVLQFDLAVKDVMSQSMSLSKEVFLTYKVIKWEGKDSVGSLPNFETRNMIVELVISISIASKGMCYWTQIQLTSAMLLIQQPSYLKSFFDWYASWNEYAKTLRSWKVLRIPNQFRVKNKSHHKKKRSSFFLEF